MLDYCLHLSARPQCRKHVQYQRAVRTAPTYCTAFSRQNVSRDPTVAPASVIFGPPFKAAKAKTPQSPKQGACIYER